MLQEPQTPHLAVECQVRARIPYPSGHFYLHLYTNTKDKKEHLALVFGDKIRSSSLDAVRPCESETDRKIRGALLDPPNPAESAKTAKAAKTTEATEATALSSPLVRIHSECYTGETVSSTRCDCGYQLAEAMHMMSQKGSGVVVYLRQEGRDIGLMEKLKAYNLQDMGHDTVTANLMLNHPADARSYEIAHLILRDLGLSHISLLTNNPDKLEKIAQSGEIVVDERVPMVPSWWLDRAAADHFETTHGIENCPTLVNHSTPSSDKFPPINSLLPTLQNTPFDSLATLSLRDDLDDSYTIIEHDSNTKSSTPQSISGTPNTVLSAVSSALALDRGVHQTLAPKTPSTPPNPDLNLNLNQKPKAHSATPFVSSAATGSSFERHIRPSKYAMSEADRYLMTKALKMGHLLDLPKF
ncbi:hypothetical protein BB560_004003 [Smittium megazygosporum]|uniref:GTP cyclohydrolase II n=1 Tax=Smittium megazygosporum TaxID=133381 RepID=A0A2T9ZAH2_9FUNG|nr:hypothetical protein BB560_004003 [Smittium megazygosporum]